MRLWWQILGLSTLVVDVKYQQVLIPNPSLQFFFTCLVSDQILMGQSAICFRYQVGIKQHDGSRQEAGRSKGARARAIKAATDLAAFEKKWNSVSTYLIWHVYDVVSKGFQSCFVLKRKANSGTTLHSQGSRAATLICHGAKWLNVAMHRRVGA